MKTESIDITKKMEVYFGLVEIGRELSIQGFMHRGMTRRQAKAASRKREQERFLRNYEPAFSSSFPDLKVWG